MDVALAFDLGTTHLKWAWADQDGREVLSQDETTLDAAAPEAVGETIAAVLGTIEKRGGTVRRTAFSAAMHTLLAVDSGGRRVSPLYTWMDPLPKPVSLGDDERRGLKGDTGLPWHSASPLAKWLALKDRLPADARPVSLKDLAIWELTGRWSQDYSTAAASGFLSRHGTWSEKALSLAGLAPDAMPELGAMDGVLADKRGTREVVLGGNDAACAHLALGVASASSRAVLAAGTSAALRTTTDAFHDHPELFCLTMGPGRGYLLGSAFSNMGNALGWLSDQLGIPFSALIPRGLSTARRGRLPLALPYWYGERSPWWRDGVTGGWLSVQASHTVDDLLGAVWLSWAAGFSRALSRLNETAGPVTEICSGSALLNTPGLAQWLADALGISVLVEPWDASLMGALSLALGSAPRQTEPARICRPKDPVLKERTEAARKALDQIMPGLLAGWPGGPKPGPKPRPQS